ncbi:MAG: aconitate hydratase AcnA [Desulfosalsimonadaceae bacterium]|nr:aconitate hydratase AcnA [Desulfosalsimonadaceae bacterium]
MATKNTFQTRDTLTVDGNSYTYFSLNKLADRLQVDLTQLPISIRILIENLLRHEDGKLVTRAHIEALTRWSSVPETAGEVPYLPARVLIQDFTGVPAIVDLAAMRDALARLGGDPKLINPRIPVHLIVDHSVQVDRFGTVYSFDYNAEKEFERNRERYTFLKWGQKSFENFNVVPPATGICHQVNLEYLAQVVMTSIDNGARWIYPDTLLGLDSHTTMINGIGVLGWGVGGIEAEAVMLGQPYYMLTPEVIGFKLTGRLPENTTATDLVLTITQILRKKGVVGKFVEFFGEGLTTLSLPDRATIANMTPEFGATTTYFPVDGQTLDYLSFTGRTANQVRLIRTYLEAQGLFFGKDMPALQFSETLALDLNTVEPSVAGPKRPHDRVPLNRVKEAFLDDFKNIYSKKQTGLAHHGRWEEEGGAVLDPEMVNPERLNRQLVLRKPFDEEKVPVHRPYLSFYLDHGSVVIAAITSCTNTSNPSVLIGAGLMAKKAVGLGLQVRPWVKTSLAPGSKVVTDYLSAAGLLPYLEALRFHLVAYGCTTCIGNSGPLQSDVAKVVEDTDLIVASVLSGNRNYEGRINSMTRANYLASPMLVIAYALAGTIDINMEKEPLAHNSNNRPVFLKDIWPTKEEISAAMKFIDPEMFRTQYSNVYEGDENWKNLPVTESERYQWEGGSTYIKNPPFFQNMSLTIPDLVDITSARVLALLGDTITTDHISPAGAIPLDSPAARYLVGQGVAKEDFNSYGSRRGNHEVMMRGTFGNVRLRNQLAPDTEGGWTRHLPTGETLYIYDAAMRYHHENTPLIVIAGKEYGSGSSRDWAAKGTMLLGVKAVIAEGFERIHRSNLVAMGVLPLQFKNGETARSLGLTGEEVFHIEGISAGLSPNEDLTVRAEKTCENPIRFNVINRLDSEVEVEYYQHNGILQYVLRQMIQNKR